MPAKHLTFTLIQRERLLSPSQMSNLGRGRGLQTHTARGTKEHRPGPTPLLSEVSPLDLDASRAGAASVLAAQPRPSQQVEQPHLRPGIPVLIALRHCLANSQSTYKCFSSLTALFHLHPCFCVTETMLRKKPDGGQDALPFPFSKKA